jgi:hypothetical protein
VKVLRHGTGWLRIAVLAFAMLVALVGASAAAAGTLRRVPQDLPTIQAAIDAAVDGDTVLVSPGRTSSGSTFARSGSPSRASPERMPR